MIQTENTKKTFTVAEITQHIKQNLEGKFHSLSIKGEILNLKKQSSGHIYFTLKDKEKDAQLSAVLFKSAAQNLEKLPKEGEEVLARGDLSVYTPRGTYQLLVTHLSYQGTGALLLKLHELKKKLAEEGLFSPERKKKLPRFPKRIGVITSPTGAVIQDIIHILERRQGNFHLILYPVKVQGEGAKEEIAQAIDDMNRLQIADVLIIGRGGGSLEDLFAFNEEIVVRAISRSLIPTLSAVGHETDVCLSDFAADLRAPTPSAAAELVLEAKIQHIQFLQVTRQRLTHHMQQLTKGAFHKLRMIQKNPYIHSPHLLLFTKIQQVEEKKGEIQKLIFALLQEKKFLLLSMQKKIENQKPAYHLKIQKEKLESLQKALHTHLKNRLQKHRMQCDPTLLYRTLQRLLQHSIRQKQERFSHLSAHLHSVDPKNLFAKGYCILFSENRHSVILSAKQLQEKQSVEVFLQDGIATAQIQEVRHDPNRGNRF